jgi:hypothetical protein
MTRIEERIETEMEKTREEITKSINTTSIKDIGKHHGEEFKKVFREEIIQVMKYVKIMVVSLAVLGGSYVVSLDFVKDILREVYVKKENVFFMLFILQSSYFIFLFNKNYDIEKKYYKRSLLVSNEKMKEGDVKMDVGINENKTMELFNNEMEFKKNEMELKNEIEIKKNEIEIKNDEIEIKNNENNENKENKKKIILIDFKNKKNISTVKF